MGAGEPPADDPPKAEDAPAAEPPDDPPDDKPPNENGIPLRNVILADGLDVLMVRMYSGRM